MKLYPNKPWPQSQNESKQIAQKSQLDGLSALSSGDSLQYFLLLCKPSTHGSMVVPPVNVSIAQCAIVRMSFLVPISACMGLTLSAASCCIWEPLCGMNGEITVGFCSNSPFVRLWEVTVPHNLDAYAAESHLGSILRQVHTTLSNKYNHKKQPI